MRRALFTIIVFVSERIRMICLTLALVVAARVMGGALLSSVSPNPERAQAIAQP